MLVSKSLFHVIAKMIWYGLFPRTFRCLFRRYIFFLRYSGSKDHDLFFLSEWVSVLQSGLVALYFWYTTVIRILFTMWGFPLFLFCVVPLFSMCFVPPLLKKIVSLEEKAIFASGCLRKSIWKVHFF